MEKTVDRHVTVRYRTQEKHRRFYFLKQLTSNEITSATTLWYSHILRIMQPLLENNFHGNTPVLSVCCQCAFKKSRTWDLNTDFCVTLHHSASLTAVFWEFKTQSLHGFNSLLNFIPDIHPSALYPPTPPPLFVPGYKFYSSLSFFPPLFLSFFWSYISSYHRLLLPTLSPHAELAWACIFCKSANVDVCARTLAHLYVTLCHM